MLTRALPRLYALLNVSRWLTLPPLERVYLAAFFAYKRYAEDPFAGLVFSDSALFRGGHILDVGANAGYTASVFAEVVDPGFQVYAFEPEQVNARRLQIVAARNRNRGKITPVKAAVGAQSGTVDLFVNPTHPGDHYVDLSRVSGSVPVPLVSLDDFCEEHQLGEVAFVKIDVQGFELAVSQGMERLMARSPRLSVAFEYSQETKSRFGYGVETLLDFYRERGFSLHLLARNPPLRPATRESIEAWDAQHGYVDVLATRQAVTG